MSSTGCRDERWPANASICSTPRCATARRPTASISRSPTSSRSPACSTSSASITSRAAIRAPIRPTPNCSPRIAISRRTFTAFGMTRRPGRSASNDPGLAALLDAKADAICFVAKSWDYHVRVALETTQRRKPRLDPRQRARGQGQGPRSAARLRAFLRRLQGQSRLTRWPAPRPPMTKARAGWCCATPMAARCRTRSRRSSARCARPSPATMSASTPITTPSRRWRIRSPRCAPARARSRARSTGSASAAATPIWSRSSRR